MKYKRILLKLSGESLMGDKQYGIDNERVKQYAEDIKAVHDKGLEIAIVIGGGNIFRGLSAEKSGMDRAQADYMGMLATVINSMALQDALEKDLGLEVQMLWHKDSDLSHFNTEDCIVLPGGFSYGDYLRCGAIARFAPMMSSIIEGAKNGLPVLGICNGFQILCESHLLPGALTRNKGLHFYCKDQELEILNNTTLWTKDFKVGEKIP